MCTTRSTQVFPTAHCTHTLSHTHSHTHAHTHSALHRGIPFVLTHLRNGEDSLKRECTYTHTHTHTHTHAHTLRITQGCSLLCSHT